MISARRVAVAFLLWNGFALWAQQYTISTFAGGGLPANILGTTASMGNITGLGSGVAVD